MRFSILALALMVSVAGQAADHGAQRAETKRSQVGPDLPQGREGVILVDRDGVAIPIKLSAREAQEQVGKKIEAFSRAENPDFEKLSMDDRARLMLKFFRDTDLSNDLYWGAYQQLAFLHALSAGKEFQVDGKREVARLTKEAMKEIARRLNLEDKYWDWDLSAEEADKLSADFEKAITEGISEALAPAAQSLGEALGKAFVQGIKESLQKAITK